MTASPRDRFPAFSPEARREAILTTAREVFIEGGLSAARTKEIAERAGVAEGLIFKYFTNKQKLFGAAVVATLDDMVQQLSAEADLFSSRDSGRSRTQLAVTFHENMQQLMAQIVPLLIALLSDRSQGHTFYQESMSPALTGIENALEHSIDGIGRFKIPPRILARVIVGSHFWFAVDKDFGAQDFDIEEIAKSVTLMLASTIEFDAPKEGR